MTPARIIVRIPPTQSRENSERRAGTRDELITTRLATSSIRLGITPSKYRTTEAWFEEGFVVDVALSSLPIQEYIDHVKYHIGGNNVGENCN